MGVINETLTLTDQFSSSFHAFIKLGDEAVKSVSTLDSNITRALGRSAGATIGAIRGLGDQAAQTNRLLEQIVENQNRHTEAIQETDALAKELLSTFKDISATTESIQRADAASGKLLSTFQKMAAMAGVSALARSFLDLSDTQASINARLGMMNDGMQSVNELNEMIYQSALRSRAAYDSTADAVAKMGLNAGNAFSSNQELVAFMEAVNKQFAIGGAGAAQMEGAMVQLTQAMSSGALRGEELNSILDAAPGIARNIEQYMGWATGSIKKYAEEGLITAEVVKYAMLDSAEAINRQFESMPMTLSQAMGQVRNVVQHSLQDSASQWNDFINSADGQRILSNMITLFSVLAEAGTDALSFLGQGALFVVDNLDMILPVLGAIGIAYGLLHAKALLAAGANVEGALASAAAWAVVHWPILLIAAAFMGALMYAQQFQFGMEEAGAAVGTVFGMLYAVGYNTFASLWNLIAAFAEFFANVWNDPLGATVRLFTSVFDSILSIVETVAGAIDALLGSDLQSAVSGFRGRISSWVDDTYGESAVQIKRMAMLDVGNTANQWGDYGGNLGAKLDNMNLNLEDIAGSFGGFNMGDIPTGDQLGDIGKVGSVGSVKNVEGDIRLADEDLKLYRDLAERRYMNQIELKTLAPNIHVTLPAGSSGTLSPEDVANYIKKMLIEQVSAQTAVSHG
ncbi:MAG: tape measure protein [Hungatella sp.]|jgi:tape measure domain-containing protein|nr:tape measure protein [Hungatella sp.]